MPNTLSIRVSDRLAALLERDAKRGDRSINSQARCILVQYYRAKGELNGEDEAKNESF
jgi:hypothetical protein